MTIGHDFVRFPELTESQMQIYYFDSPHKQITQDFIAEVVKVHDGDTISLKWQDRDFIFPLRFMDIAAPELNEAGGKESQSWLETLLLGEEVEIKINRFKRVEKWGRLLGRVVHKGMDVGNESILTGKSVAWERRNDGKIMDFDKEMKRIWD